MSLLLKALQNAAKNREAAGTPEAENDPGNVERSAAPGELSLEPVQPTARTASRTQSSTGEETAARHAAPGPQQAQTVFRAGARPARVSRSAPGIFDWLARRPLVAFSTAAGLFAIGYGVYLYLQITNPGMFVAQPSAPPPPPPPQVATAPRSTVPAPPATEPLAVPPGPAGSATNPAAASGPTVPPSASAVPAAPGAPPSMTGSVPGGTAGSPSAGAAPAVTPPAPPSPARPAPSERMATERASSGPGTAPTPADRSATSATPAGSMGVPPGPATRTAPPGAPTSGSIAMAPSVSSSAATPPMASRSGVKPSRPAAKTSAAAAQEPPEGVAPAAGPQIIAVDSAILSAYQALELGRLEEAERLYRQAMSSNPRNTDAMLGLAATLSQQNKGDAASQLYLRVLEQDPRNAFAQAGLLNIGGRADPAAAEARLKQLIGREPSAFLYFTLGNLYSERGHWASAQNAYFQAHNLAPDNPDYAFNLAVGLEHLSQPKIALDYYRRAVALAQSRGHAQFEVARVENRIRSLEATLANP